MQYDCKCDCIEETAFVGEKQEFKIFKIKDLKIEESITQMFTSDQLKNKCRENGYFLLCIHSYIY